MPAGLSPSSTRRTWTALLRFTRADRFHRHSCRLVRQLCSRNRLGAVPYRRTTLLAYRLLPLNNLCAERHLLSTYGIGLRLADEDATRSEHPSDTDTEFHDNGDQSMNAFDYINAKQQAALKLEIFFTPLFPTSQLAERAFRSMPSHVDYGAWAAARVGMLGIQVSALIPGAVYSGDRKTFIRALR